MQPEDAERWQAYDEQGRPIPDSGLTKQQARTGLLHAASHIWIWREYEDRIQVLMQRRPDDKATWPGHFDVSAAGHIDLGETPVEAAYRETKEELGLDISPDDLRLLFVYRDRLDVLDTGIIENEFQWVYGYRMVDDHDLDDAQGEVETVRWTDADEIDGLIAGHSHLKVVPHGRLYFSNLMERLESLREAA